MDCMRRTDMFSPIVAIASVMTVETGLAAHVGCVQRVDVGHVYSDVSNAGNHFLEVGVFANEVGLGV